MKSAVEVSEPLISLEDVSFIVHEREMISKVSWSLSSGQCMSVVGPNGAGKTTMLRILCGLHRGYQGSAKIAGKEIKQEPIESLARLVSLVPQRMEFLPGFTVYEFIELSGARHAPHVASLVGDLGNRLLPELSAGELQRAIIAGAIAQGVRVLLLDEPTANLDPQGRSQVEEILTRSRDEMGLSYILVTHDISLALRCCSRMLILANGESHWQGETTDDEVVGNLERAYGCGFVRLSHPSIEQSVVVPT